VLTTLRRSAIAALLTACASGEPAPPSPVVVPPFTAPPAVHVQVLAFNDFHGNLEPPHGHDGTVRSLAGDHIPAGGAAYLATVIAAWKKKNPNTIVVSAGDLTGASPLVSNLFKDDPTIEAMNDIGLDFEAVGNHDFDRGLDDLRRMQTLAKFHYLAANVLGPDHKTVFPPYEVRDIGGVKVAIIGMTLKGTPSVTTKEAVQGLTFEDEAKTANALLPELHDKGVHAAVVVIHQGGFQGEGGTFDSCVGFSGDVTPVLDALDPAFRVVLTAHTHQAYNCTIGGRVVTSAGSYGRLVTVIDLAINPTSDEIVDVHATNIPVGHDVPPDGEVSRLVADFQDKARPVTDRIVGYQRGPLTRDPKGAATGSCETPLGDVIADAELAATKSAGAVFALMNPGGIRTDLTPSPGGTAAEPIRYAAAFEVQPFGNKLVTLSLAGKDILTVLQHQFGKDRPRILSVSKGFSYKYVYNAADKSVTIDPASVALGGKKLEVDKTYRVTVNSFLADGGDGFATFRDAPERTEGPVDIDALVAYLSKNSSSAAPLVAPAKLDRIDGNACR
jgi:5'-nucleotidase